MLGKGASKKVAVFISPENLGLKGVLGALRIPKSNPNLLTC